jgi:hypothetical protein
VYYCLFLDLLLKLRHDLNLLIQFLLPLFRGQGFLLKKIIITKAKGEGNKGKRGHCWQAKVCTGKSGEQRLEGVFIF